MLNWVKVNSRDPEQTLPSTRIFGRWQGMGVLDQVRSMLEAKKKSLGTQEKLAEATGISQSTISRVLKPGGGGISGVGLAKAIEALGAKIVFPEDIQDTTREVAWIEPIKPTSVRSTPLNPDAIRYAAVPLAEGPVAAGPGLIPEDSIRGWILALKEHSSIRYRRNLVAVEIGKGQMSMVPTLHPLDIVLVDRDDIRPEPDGSIFLVRDPDDAVAVKRVYAQHKNGGTIIQLVSDNPDKREYPPMVYSLEEDYGGEMQRVIVGKVVWAWSDMTRK